MLVGRRQCWAARVVILRCDKIATLLQHLVEIGVTSLAIFLLTIVVPGDTVDWLEIQYRLTAAARDDFAESEIEFVWKTFVNFILLFLLSIFSFYSLFYGLNDLIGEMNFCGGDAERCRQNHRQRTFRCDAKDVDFVRINLS